jgi:hypothetical protein
MKMTQRVKPRGRTRDEYRWIELDQDSIYVLRMSTSVRLLVARLQDVICEFDSSPLSLSSARRIFRGDHAQDNCSSLLSSLIRARS